MFFLGGFNSIIPHLLYLSLIWALMIIGLSGKINAVWHFLIPADPQAEKEVIHFSAGEHAFYANISLDPDRHGTHVDHIGDQAETQSNDFAFLSFSDFVPLPEIICATSFRYINSLTFRGPPVRIS